MSVIATVEVPAREFALGAALGSNPGTGVRVERVVPLGDAVLPYVWVSDDAVEDLAASLRSEAAVESVRVVDEVNDEALVRVDWTADLDGLLGVIAHSDALILEAVGGDDAWRFQLRFPDHADLTEFYRQCTQREVHLDLRSVHNPGPPTDVSLGLVLSDVQRETLAHALEAGYFDVPRDTNLVELAAEADVSDTAMSQRLRRGIKTLLEATLVEDGNDTTDSL